MDGLFLVQIVAVALGLVNLVGNPSLYKKSEVISLALALDKYLAVLVQFLVDIIKLPVAVSAAKAQTGISRQSSMTAAAYSNLFFMIICTSGFMSSE